MAALTISISNCSVDTSGEETNGSKQTKANFKRQHEFDKVNGECFGGKSGTTVVCGALVAVARVDGCLLWEEYQNFRPSRNIIGWKA